MNFRWSLLGFNKTIKHKKYRRTFQMAYKLFTLLKHWRDIFHMCLRAVQWWINEPLSWKNRLEPPFVRSFRPKISFIESSAFSSLKYSHAEHLLGKRRWTVFRRSVVFPLKEANTKGSIYWRRNCLLSRRFS